MDTVKDKIRQRRTQILAHSYLYYVMDAPIILDITWDHWAEELVKIQATYPECCEIDWYDDVFKDWDGKSGANLPKDYWIAKKALLLFRYHKEAEEDATRTIPT